jgi:hypothetical protein
MFLKFIPYIPAINAGKEIHTVIMVNVLNILFCSKSIFIYIVSQVIKFSKLNWIWSEITAISSSSKLILVVIVLAQIYFVSVNAVFFEITYRFFNQ